MIKPNDTNRPEFPVIDMIQLTFTHGKIVD